MNILHLISGNLEGGAAKGAYLLHKGLHKFEVNSRILTNSRNTFKDPSISSINNTKCQQLLNNVRDKIDGLPTILYPKRERRIFSTSFIGYNFRNHALCEWADIIHLHWINKGFLNIKHLSKITKPIVWTMRDMWPFTGGCHYSLECDHYKKECGECLQLNSDFLHDLSWIVNKRKEKYLPQKIKFIGISSWLSKKANESSLLKDYDIVTIPNNISSNEFYPIEKNFAKSSLGINTEKKIILAGAQNLEDFYKGFDKYLSAINQLDPAKYYLTFFGKVNTNSINNLGFEYKCFGYLHDTISLRMVYSAADVFVAPSLMDAFCKTVAESMACGTPVVCFNNAGPKDIVDHKVNGYKAKPFYSDDLANGIEWILNCNTYTDLSKRAVKKVLENFDVEVIAKQYINLYEDIISNK